MEQMRIARVFTKLGICAKAKPFSADSCEGPGGGTSICGVHGGVPRIGVIFSRKKSEKCMSIFHKNFGKSYNMCKKFQMGSVILMTQMTNQKKTELFL